MALAQLMGAQPQYRRPNWLHMTLLVMCGCNYAEVSDAVCGVVLHCCSKSAQLRRTQESFKKVVTTLITRRNHWNDLYYRDDPTIMGWELANEPHMPGDDSGNVLKARMPASDRPALGDQTSHGMAGGLVVTDDVIPTEVAHTHGHYPLG